MFDDPSNHRRAIAGRVLAAIAVSRRLPTFDDLGRDLRDVGKNELTAALDELTRRNLIAVVKTPSTRHPLLDPPIVCYQSVALERGLRNV